MSDVKAADAASEISASGTTLKPTDADAASQTTAATAEAKASLDGKDGKDAAPKTTPDGLPILRQAGMLSFN